MDRETFDELMAATDPAMVVVTADADGERSGCLVGFHCQSSIEPPQYAVWLSKANHTYGIATRATHLAVHFLTSADHELARIFGALTGDEVDKFELVTSHSTTGGAPRIESSENGLVGTVAKVLDAGGDHVAIILDPIEVWSSGGFTPLRLAGVDDLDPGHPAGDD